MPRDGSAEDDFPTLVQGAVSGYLRGQLLFSLTMGAAVAITVTIFGLVGLFPAGTTYSWFFGVFYGLMEFIPYIGPIIGPIPALLVALFQHQHRSARRGQVARRDQSVVSAAHYGDVDRVIDVGIGTRHGPSIPRNRPESPPGRRLACGRHDVRAGNRWCSSPRPPCAVIECRGIR